MLFSCFLLFFKTYVYSYCFVRYLIYLQYFKREKILYFVIVFADIAVNIFG